VATFSFERFSKAGKESLAYPAVSGMDYSRQQRDPPSSSPDGHFLRHKDCHLFRTTELQCLLRLLVFQRNAQPFRRNCGYGCADNLLLIGFAASRVGFTAASSPFENHPKNTRRTSTSSMQYAAILADPGYILRQSGQLLFIGAAQAKDRPRC
jgi:hypothetical protein